MSHVLQASGWKENNVKVLPHSGKIILHNGCFTFPFLVPTNKNKCDESYKHLNREMKDTNVNKAIEFLESLALFLINIHSQML